MNKNIVSSPLEAVGRSRRYFREVFGVNAERSKVRGGTVFFK